MIAVGLLLLVFSSTVSCAHPFFTPPSGVQYNTEESYLVANGMVKCLDVPYSTPIYESSFAGCGESSWVFVGAKFSSSENIIFLGAFGLATDVFRFTNSRLIAYESNGVFWYKFQFFAFGFSSARNIALNRADVATNSPADRLSWHYNSNNFGGWRAGIYDFLNNDNNFRKVIYRLPQGAGAPTPVPTVALPSCLVPYPHYLGDGYCDSEGAYNTAQCDYDRGDCCIETCVPGLYNCGIVGFNCLDPRVNKPTTKPTSYPPTSAPSPVELTDAPLPVLPTVAPSLRPTYVPSFSAVPTEQHSMSPTADSFDLSDSPSAAPVAELTHAPLPVLPTLAPSLHPTYVPSFSAVPTEQHSMSPTADSLDLSDSPSAAPSTGPSPSSTDILVSEFIQMYHFDSDRPYKSDQDIYHKFQFPNMTSYDNGEFYYTTITFTENTRLRQGIDYIKFFTDEQLSNVYGAPQYSGDRFPGMNGEAALGFRAFRFVFHFHAGPGDVPEDHGYMMNVKIKRFSSASDVPVDNIADSVMHKESNAGMTALFSVLLTWSILSCCCLLFYYKRAISSAKILAEEEVFDHRLQEHREALQRTRAVAQKGKLPKRPIKKDNRILEPDLDPTAVKEPPLKYMCPISCELMLDPVICSDGYTYDRASIEMWLAAHGTSPMTNAPLVDNTMVPNLALKSIIQNFNESCNV